MGAGEDKTTMGMGEGWGEEDSILQLLGYMTERSTISLRMFQKVFSKTYT